jgi:hypothetical protein
LSRSLSYAIFLNTQRPAIFAVAHRTSDLSRYSVPTKTHILNLLHRLIDGKEDKIARIDAPQALELRREPKADVERYDALRMKDLRHAS